MTLRGYVICPSWQKLAASVALGACFYILRNDEAFKRKRCKGPHASVFLYWEHLLNKKLYIYASPFLEYTHVLYLIFNIKIEATIK